MAESNNSRRDEFTQLLSDCERRLFSYILALVWNVQDAEDLYQATAMTLWEKFDDFEPGTDFLRWSFATARLLTSNFQRTQRRHGEFLTPDLAETLADRNASLPAGQFDLLAESLVDCMDHLSATDRRLVQLCYGEENPIKDIAEKIGRSAQSTYNSLFRIRRSLFDCIQRAASRKADA